MAKVYEPCKVEKQIYDNWEQNGYFKGVIDPEKKPFTIVIPPPNITGQLHMGHALDETLQDIIIRYKRMQGYSALWLPGTDHASIATEAKIVDALAKEGLTKEEIGREEFLKRAWAWREKYGRTLPVSVNLSRADLFDPGLTERLSRVFNRGFWDGYYQGQRLGEWTRSYGNKASRKKVYAAKCTNFFKNLSVAEFVVEAVEAVEQGADCLIIGETTGVYECRLDDIRDAEGKPTRRVEKGQFFSLKTDRIIRRGDKLYLWQTEN